MSEIKGIRDRLRPDRSTVSVLATTLAIQAALVVTGIASARLLGPGDRGWLGLVVAIAMATSGIALLGFPSAVTYLVASRRDSGFESLRRMRKWLLAQTVGALIVSLAIALLAFSGAPGDVLGWALLVVCAAVVLVFYQYLLAVLQGRGGFKAFNIARSAMTIIYTFWVVLFLAFAWRPNAEVFALAWLSGLVIASLLAWWLARDRELSTPRGLGDPEFIRSYGLRSFLGVRPPLESLNLDQVLIGIVGGPLILGFYVVSTALTNLPRFMAESIGMVAFPRVAGATDIEQVRQSRNALLLTAVISATTVALLAAIAPSIVPWLFGESFQPAVSVMRIMLVATFFLSLRRILGDVLRGFGSPSPSSVAEVVAIFVFAASLVPLVHRWEADGAAIAYAAAAAISTAIVILAYVIRVRNIKREFGARSRGEECLNPQG